MKEKIREKATMLAVDHANADISTFQLIDGIVKLVEEQMVKAHVAHAPRHFQGCPSCGGSGSVEKDGKLMPCDRCGGNG